MNVLKKKGAFQIVASVLRLWSTPTTAVFPGWCPHQPATIRNTPKKNSLMINNKYFRNLKKTGPPVETGRPLRLLDMRIFTCLCCAGTTALQWEDRERLPASTIACLFSNPFNVTNVRSCSKVNQSTYSLLYYR
jgi:UDP:flavonoid glycosyltransferase YjiC (YdhE family)